MKHWQMLLGTLLISSSISMAQSQREVYYASVKAHHNKDYETFLRHTKSLDSLRPFHPIYTYNLAAANALTGNPEQALMALTKLVLMDNTAAFENDEDFKSLQQDQGFKDIIALKAAQGKLAETSKQVVTLSEKELHPEGLAYLPKSKKWLASSIRERKIISFDLKTGQCTDWLKGQELLSVFALKADADEKFLWVATTALPQMEGYDKTFEGRAEVLKIDLKSKQVVKRFRVKGHHAFGDLALAKNGTVYVSDSVKPTVYKIENGEISEFVSFENDGFNLQGLALNDSQNTLFVADYLKGITALDIKSKTKKALVFPDLTSPKGIDGLVFYKNKLIAIQNGVKPIRITQIQLNDQQNEISNLKILDNNRPEFNEPALGTLVGDKLYFFANSPWNAYDEKDVLDESKVTNPVLFSCKLD